MEVTVLNQQEKHRLVMWHAQHYRVLVETGLWNGQGATTTAIEQRPTLKCYAIDLDRENVRKANGRGVVAFLGDSGSRLGWLLSWLAEPACFWLDAHAATEGDDYLRAHPCPLISELAAILRWEYAAASTVLIDDLRLLGAPGWPTRSDVADLDPGLVWDVREQDDILRLTPR